MAQILTDRNIITVAGHTDSDGPDEYNENLSLRRAYSVYSYLRDINAKVHSMWIEAYGERRPIAPNNTPSGKEKNRRVEITIKTVTLEGSDEEGLGGDVNNHESDGFVDKIARFIQRISYIIIIAFVAGIIGFFAALISIIGWCKEYYASHHAP